MFLVMLHLYKMLFLHHQNYKQHLLYYHLQKLHHKNFQFHLQLYFHHLYR
uniref:Uncharacterized protein n=1 Tax=uncultured marine virus TaxID=186617 RepID=A0A0F7L9G2_9VIRU|nr:hypothetical protein [uncultured marine virus]